MKFDSVSQSMRGVGETSLHAEQNTNNDEQASTDNLLAKVGEVFRPQLKLGTPIKDAFTMPDAQQLSGLVEQLDIPSKIPGRIAPEQEN